MALVVRVREEMASDKQNVGRNEKAIANIPLMVLGHFVWANRCDGVMK